MKTISIIVPFYNANKHIRNCFCCIIKQTYEHRLIECLFIDDGSSDNSLEIVTKVIQEYEGDIIFRIIKHKQNLGVSESRNTGIKEATCDYIYFMDVDDIITENCIETLIKAHKMYPYAQMVVGNVINKKSQQYHHSTIGFTIRQDHRQNMHDTLLFIYAGFPVNRLISRDFLLRNNLFFPIDMRYFEDLSWNIDIALCIKTIVYVPEVTYIYEYVNSSTMSSISKNIDEVTKCQIKLIDKVFSLKEPFVESFIFICYYIQAILNSSTSDPIIRQNVKNKRIQLLGLALKKRKFLLFLYGLLLYHPFRKVMSFKPLRNKAVCLKMRICYLSNKYNI